MTGVEFGALPPSARRGDPTAGAAHWAAVAAELRTRPGEWARVATAAKRRANATMIKQGRLAAFRPVGHFEATLRAAGKDADGAGLYDLWARYTGGQS